MKECGIHLLVIKSDHSIQFMSLVDALYSYVFHAIVLTDLHMQFKDKHVA